MSMFYQCPICWDGEGLCRCTESDHIQYEADLEKDRKKYIQEERLRFHKLLDFSFGLHHLSLPVFKAFFHHLLYLAHRQESVQ